MKQNWQTPVAIASLVLAIFATVMGMNRVSEDGAVALEARLQIVERDNIEMKRRIDANEKRLSGRFGFMNDVTSRLEWLCRTEPGCGARFGPMRLPE